MKSKSCKKSDQGICIENQISEKLEESKLKGLMDSKYFKIFSTIFILFCLVYFINYSLYDIFTKFNFTALLIASTLPMEQFQYSISIAVLTSLIFPFFEKDHISPLLYVAIIFSSVKLQFSKNSSKNIAIYILFLLSIFTCVVLWTVVTLFFNEHLIFGDIICSSLCIIMSCISKFF